MPLFVVQWLVQRRRDSFVRRWRNRGIYNGRNTKEARRKLPRDLWAIAQRKLSLLNAASALDDLKAPPGNRLEALSSDLAGKHSIRINDQYRIVFRWAEGATEVWVGDYN